MKSSFYLSLPIRNNYDLYSPHALFLSIASYLELPTFKVDFILYGIAFLLCCFQQVL